MKRGISVSPGLALGLGILSLVFLGFYGRPGSNSGGGQGRKTANSQSDRYPAGGSTHPSSRPATSNTTDRLGSSGRSAELDPASRPATVGLGTTSRKVPLPALRKFAAEYPLPPAQIDGVSPLLLLFTGAMNGYFEPCGCQSDMLGGLAKYLSLLEFYRQNNRSFFLLDGGNTFFEREEIPPSKREQALLKAQLIARLYRKLGYTAVGIGPIDLRFGLRFLKKLIDENRLPAVSSNLVYKGSQSTVFSPYKTVRWRGYRIAVFAITGHLRRSPSDSEIGVVPPEKALARHREVLTSADFVILLSTVGLRALPPILTAFPQIDLVVEAGENSPQGQISTVGDVPVVIPSKDGKKLGVFSLYIRDKKLDKTPVITAVQLQEKIAQLERQRREYLSNARKLRQKGGDMAVLASIYLSQADELKKEIFELRKRASQPPRLPAGKNGYIAQLIPIKTVIPDHPEATAEIERYQLQVNRANLAALKNLKPIPHDSRGNFFAGVQKCKLCHAPQYFAWKKTRHADAYNTLVKKNRHLDFDCIGCHTTGWLKPGGLYRLKQIPKLKDVQCEVCHGRGGLHSKNPKKSNIHLTPNRNVCTSCHRDEHAPHFKFEKKVVRILSKNHGYKLLLRYLQKKKE